MNDFIESCVAFMIIAGVAIGGFIVILIVNPWFWLAVIAYILATNL